MTFALPYALLLLPVLAVAFWWTRRRATESAMTFGTVSVMRAAGRSRRQKLLWLPETAWWLGLALLALAIARPQTETQQVREEAEGIAIAMLLDVSSSMEIRLDRRTEPTSRFNAAKEVLANFVLGNGGNLPGRPHDLIGLFTFARYADTISPMTHAHETLISMVSELELSARPNEDGTAFGDAIALAAARLKTLESTHADGALPTGIRSKIIILLSDGENNSGNHLPLQAAALARDWGIRVYTVMLGEGSLAFAGKTSVDEIPPPNEAEITLEEIAKATGGIFRNAYDFDSLHAVYEEIDALEMSHVSLVTYTDHTDRFQWFAAPAFFLLGLSRTLANTFLRTVP